ncbi:BlaI/MecI/CopY family transcriptional regulator [Singulisphaera sp. Ch08]|uniref:BlaI/MecI/CopY family transcriptional regulator n=1 Tax=Singulisphaera sp. Ch08 TaxID=3120278 RepID=A0AAU7CI66_9BACT
MARPPSAHPTDAELEILKILWDVGPAELGPIVTSLNLGRAVATTTVATTLKIMMQKGWVERRQGERGYLWAALVTQKDATSGLLRKLLDRAFDGSAGRLVARLVEDGALSERDREEIRRLLDADAAPKTDRGRRP